MTVKATLEHLQDRPLPERLAAAAVLVEAAAADRRLTATDRVKLLLALGLLVGVADRAA